MGCDKMDVNKFKFIAEHPNKPLTVKALREFLCNLEESWTEEDEKYMGQFEQQKLYVPYFTQEGKFEGYGWASIFYDGGLDFIIDRGDL